MKIKFKAQRADTKEWVYGHYTEGSAGYHYITTPDGCVWQVIPETVGQFTTAYDCENEPVYEDSLIKNEDTGDIQVVYWNDEKYAWYCGYINQDRIVSLAESLGNLNIVIGSIHDQQEEQK